MNNTHVGCQMTTWMANVASHFRHDETTKAHKITQDISSSNTPPPAWISIAFAPPPPIRLRISRNSSVWGVLCFGLILQYVSFIFNNVTVLFSKETLLIKLVEMPYGF